ncbi:MAG: ATP synthase F1 subunit delta, partial [Flavobacteriales bacterium]
MKDSKTASRYAKALLGLSQESGKLEEVVADMNSLSETLAQSADLRSLVKNPVIKGEEKTKVFTALFGSQFNELTLNTIQLLVKNKRETLLAETANQFVGMYKESKNIVTAEVTSASQ